MLNFTTITTLKDDADNTPHRRECAPPRTAFHFSRPFRLLFRALTRRLRDEDEMVMVIA